ncbi:MAG TPA: ribonuclease H-like domain-containing protein [Nitrospira sp.]|nr:ribonuclease H-like domain-containing protein [Nitrospira sp.]
MIQSSFCFLAGVGLRTERRLWRAGVATWSQFVATASIRGIGRARKALYDTAISRAQERYAGDDARYFGVTLHQRDHWRLYEWLRSKAVYLDIETDSFGRITVVGLYGGGRFTSFTRGESLDARRLGAELSQYDLLVTFCGTTFDLPMLLARYPDLPLDQPHIDLCFVGKQLGYRGGLKAIEMQMGISRASGLEGLNGSDAVHLWNRWRHSRDAESRERLLAYNEADCVNLERLADAFYARMAQSTMRDLPSPLAALQRSS